MLRDETHGDRTASTPVARGFEFTGAQLELYEELDRRQRLSGRGETRLAHMYHGALLALTQVDNPDRSSLAAHSVRELIEKLPRYLITPVSEELRVSEDRPLHQRVREFGVLLRSRSVASMCRTEDGWSGEIDGPAAEILQSAERLVEEFAEDHPDRATQAGRTLRALARGAEPLPETYEDQLARTLYELEGYFLQVSHHRFAPSSDEMEDRLRRLTDLLLDFVRPRSVAAMEQLDALISEAERGTDG